MIRALPLIGARCLGARPKLTTLLLVAAMTNGILETAQGTAEDASTTEQHACTDYYFGNGVSQSYAKAFDCFQKSNDGVWLILMMVNGEGPLLPSKRVRELLADAKESCDWCDPGDLEGVVSTIESARQDPASLTKGRKIRICDLAEGTNNFEICWADFKADMQTSNDREFKAIAAKLSPPVRARLQALGDLVAQFKNKDGMWMYDEIGGTARGTGAQFQEILDQSNFAALVRNVVRDHALQRRTAEELQDKDRKLNAAYRLRIANATSDWDAMLKDEASKDSWSNISRQRSQYLESAKVAETSWIKLQEPWEKLCAELYRGEISPEEIDRAIDTAIREVRIQEIECQTTCDKDFFGTTLGYGPNQ